MKAVAFDGLENLFFFLLFLVDLVQRLRVRLERMYENYDRQNVAGHISNTLMICVWVMMLKIPSNGLGIVKM